MFRAGLLYWDSVSAVPGVETRRPNINMFTYTALCLCEHDEVCGERNCPAWRTKLPSVANEIAQHPQGIGAMLRWLHDIKGSLYYSVDNHVLGALELFLPAVTDTSLLEFLATGGSPGAAAPTAAEDALVYDAALRWSCCSVLTLDRDIKEAARKIITRDLTTRAIRHAVGKRLRQQVQAWSGTVFGCARN